MRSNHRPWLVGWLAIGSMVVKLLFTFCELHKKNDVGGRTAYFLATVVGHH